MRGRTGKNIRGTIQIEGLDELVTKLRRLGADVEAELERAMVAGASEIKEEANRLAPGPHIDIEVEESGKGHVQVAVGPVEEKWYYRFFELGAQAHEITGQPLVFEGEEGLVVTGRVSHPGMAARPFLRPAMDRKGQQAIDKVKDHLKRAIEKVK